MPRRRGIFVVVDLLEAQSRRRKTDAGPSTSLRFAQDDRSELEDKSETNENELLSHQTYNVVDNHQIFGGRNDAHRDR